ncbi:MAG: hypothetical protein GWN10_23480, partial [Nitrospinaceae bacterium]|nr:hypothetical protein [Nitrospinaceae bacterium]NIX37046.1 hypothetical protein [Nitrospinaceae bacterium]
AGAWNIADGGNSMGNISILADNSLAIAGVDFSGNPSTISSWLVNYTGTPAGISLTAPTINIAGGALIETQSIGDFNLVSVSQSGNIDLIAATSLNLDGTVSTMTDLPFSLNFPGWIGITTPLLQLSDNSLVSVANFGFGDGGLIAVTHPDSLGISGGGTIQIDLATPISGGGNGGLLYFDSPIIDVTGTNIIAEVPDGPVSTRNGGAIFFFAPNQLTLRSAFLASGSSSPGLGGDITLISRDVLITESTHIFTSVGFSDIGAPDAGSIGIFGFDADPNFNTLRIDSGTTLAANGFFMGYGGRAGDIVMSNFRTIDIDSSILSSSVSGGVWENAGGQAGNILMDATESI